MFALRPQLLLVTAIAAGVALLVPAPPVAARNAQESPAASSQLRAAKQSEAASSGPLTIIVSIGRQRVAVYDGTRRIAESPISSGTASNPTPTGIFSILEKNRIHFSNLYNDAPMPFMQRITWSGVALHAGHLPGYPASHGCIRLPHSFAAQLFAMTKRGGRVIVTRDEPLPQSFAHEKLPAPLPSAEAVVAQTKGVDPAGVNMLIGVSTATAAPVDGALIARDGRRTREAVAAERAAEKAAIVSALDKAKAGEAATAQALVEASAKAADARGTLKRYRDEAEAIEREMARVDRARIQVEQQTAAFLRRNAGQAEEPTEKAVETEDQLEARMLQLHHETDALKADLEDQRHFIPRAAAEADDAEAVRAAAAADHAKASRLLADVKEELSDWDRAEARRHLPPTIFVSRKTGTLAIRQGYEPILEVPVRFAHPEAPLGTHVFTALAFTNGDQALTWSAVTVAAREDEPARNRKPARDGEAALQPAALKPPPPTAQSALDRLVIPDDVAERIAEIIKPGASLIISDQGPSNETGKFTDFIVSTR